MAAAEILRSPIICPISFIVALVPRWTLFNRRDVVKMMNTRPTVRLLHIHPPRICGPLQSLHHRQAPRIHGRIPAYYKLYYACIRYLNLPLYDLRRQKPPVRDVSWNVTIFFFPRKNDRILPLCTYSILSTILPIYFNLQSFLRTGKYFRCQRLITRAIYVKVMHVPPSQ